MTRVNDFCKMWKKIFTGRVSIGSKSLATVARLAFKEVKKDLTPWYSLAITSSFVAIGLIFFLATISGGQGFGGDIGAAYRQIGDNGLALLILIGVLSVNSSAKVAVSLQRQDLLIWRLTGVTEKQAKFIVVTEVLISSSAGALCGCVLGFAGWPVWKLILASANMPYTDKLPSLPPMWSLPAVIIAVVITALLGGNSAGKKASEMRPMTIMRGVEDVVWKPRWVRLLFIVLSVAVIAVSYFIVAKTPSSSSIETITQKTTFFYVTQAALYALLIGLSGQWFISRFLNAWTQVIPPRISTTWFLAKKQSGEDVEVSTSLVVPLAVSLILMTGIYGWIGQAQDASRALGVPFQGQGINVGSLVIWFGWPILITLVNAGGLAMATGQTKRKDAALLLIAGAPTHQVTVKILYECFILVFTSTLLSTIVYFVNGLIFVLMLRLGPIPEAGFVWPNVAPFAVAGLALIIFALSSLATYAKLSRSALVALARG